MNNFRDADELLLRAVDMVLVMTGDLDHANRGGH
jgi:hypothetical protein